MKFTTLFYAIFGAIITVVVLNLVALLGVIGVQDELIEASERRYQSYMLADELRQSSDDLTRLARTYSVTGDSHYIDQYNAILDIRNGKIPRPMNYERIYWDFVEVNNQKPRPDSNETIALTKKMEALDLLLIAVRPDYQNKGLNSLLFIDQIPRYHKYGIKEARVTAVLETNTKNQANFQYLEHEFYKRRRAYIKNL